MPRTGSAYLFMLAIMSLAAVAPSSGWAQGAPVKLTNNTQSDSGPVWSPDGTKIAFVSERTGDEEIYAMNADGTNPVQLTRRGVHDFGPARWSPDGTKIVFMSSPTGENEIYVVNADGTNLVRLTQNDDPDGSPAWSPDGTKIVFVSHRDGDDEIYVVNADGTNLVRLTQNAGAGGSPAWSPDGTKIVFVSHRDGDDEIYVMNADGTNPVRLTQNAGAGESPAWSPDGTKIVFVSHRDGDNEIYVMNADGTNLARLTQNAGNDLDPAWSPDGAKIAFMSYRRTGDNEIYVMNADGTNLVRLTQNAGHDGSPVWSPDGTKIAFESSRDGDYEIYVIPYGPAVDPGNTERGDRRATLLNLSPWQAWVHLYCLKDRGTDAAPCAVTFECNGQSGEPAAWPVEVAPKTIFSYWPNKTAPDGTDADLQAALIAAGKPEDEARRRTTCEVFSPDPLTVRGYTLFGGQPTLVPVAEPARPDMTAAPGERRRQATLPNLSPGQAWVHLYCLKDRGPDATPCAVTFECNGQSGEPVTWPVEIAPKTIFSYWPNKTVDGLSADLQAALIAAGKPEDEARRRTTCEVSSADPIAVRGYTRFGGQPTLVPVTAY